MKITKDRVVTYESERKADKITRPYVKRLLKDGIEPEPEYRTGKCWDD